MSIFFRGLIDKLGIHGLSYGYTDGFEEKSLSIIRKTARVSQRVYLYIYIMFNDELTIAMVMVIRYYRNDPFHGNSSTRWKEDIEPVVT